jgi:hypothetical protein
MVLNPGSSSVGAAAPPDAALAAAQTKGRERYEGYVEALGRRLARGRKLSDEIVRDVEVTALEGEPESPERQTRVSSS